MENRGNYLRERFGMMAGYLGLLLMIIAGLIIVPLVVVPFTPSEVVYTPGFLVTSALLAGLGLFLRQLFPHKELQSLDFKESSVVVFLSWIISCLAGALPYMLISKMSFSHALFDSVSGWTTTGLTLLDISSAPVIMLFYRAWTQFVGGAGFAIIMLASLTGVGAPHFYSAEGKGYLIRPNVLSSARIVVSLYVGYLILGIIAYLLSGLTALDAIVLSFCAISTGGFANYPQSIGFFDSPLIEAITILLMLLGNLSFLSAYFIVKGRIRIVSRNGEIKVFAAALLFTIPLMFLGITSHIFTSSTKALRVAVFETISALTTTGFQTVSYNHALWLQGGLFLLILLQLVGGGTCSTAGGIKQYRVYMIWKTIVWHLKSSLLPTRAVSKYYIWEGDLKSYVNDAKLREIASFIFAYLGIYMLGVTVISFATDPLTGMRYSLSHAMFEFASALGTVGLTVGVTSLEASPQVIWAETAGMLLGRLEIFVVIVAIGKLARDTWRGLVLR
jgi:trk system potassium uptake protein TrkH